LLTVKIQHYTGKNWQDKIQTWDQKNITLFKESRIVQASKHQHFIWMKCAPNSWDIFEGLGIFSLKTLRCIIK
jgi:hypothetical protein